MMLLELRPYRVGNGVHNLSGTLIVRFCPRYPYKLYNNMRARALDGDMALLMRIVAGGQHVIIAVCVCACGI